MFLTHFISTRIEKLWKIDKARGLLALGILFNLEVSSTVIHLPLVDWRRTTSNMPFGHQQIICNVKTNIIVHICEHQAHFTEPLIPLCDSYTRQGSSTHPRASPILTLWPFSTAQFHPPFRLTFSPIQPSSRVGL